MRTSSSIPQCIFLAVLFIPNGLCQSDDDRYTDENRPYKFGFNIEGYQHRQEEKNERGIIKGEYGFITADGYYRVTVYATDENGDFRIISMKNYYVGFPPEDPTTTPQPPSQGNRAGPRIGLTNGGTNGEVRPKGTTLRGPGRNHIQKQRAEELVKLNVQGLSACSDCKIPTTTPSPDRGRPGFGAGGSRGNSRFSESTGTGAPPRSGFSSGGGVSGGRGPTPEGGSGGGSGGSRGSSRPSGESNRFGGAGGRGGRPGGSRGGAAAGANGFDDGNDIGGGRPDIGRVQDGLPKGVSVGDIKALLYRFNYTVGFHGHHEDGYRNGDKEGDYFFDGRDGTERRVEYLANEFGYQPNITFVDLPENDVRRPKEDTEQEYGLKGYEFKWFYRK